jgi:hypothetical protein
MTTAFRISNVRLRFFLVLVILCLVVGQWDALWNYWEKLSRTTNNGPQQGVSSGLEYWCPMCPGVVSDWPAKCPVCNMALVQRAKHEAVPLPNGVMSRMQLSPYRIQLAGIKTSPISFQPLVREIITGGLMEDDKNAKVEVFGRDLPYLQDDQSAEVSSEAVPGHVSIAGRVRIKRSRLIGDRGIFPIRLEINDPHGDLRPGMFVTAQIRVSPNQWPWYTRYLMDNWRDQTAAELVGRHLIAPVHPAPGAGLESLLRMAIHETLLHQGLVAAIPETAVLDTGRQKVVYVESGPGMFDGLEVQVGPKCGEFYPLLRGLDLDRRIATAGAFLIDAESRLNPAAASIYFGSGISQQEPTKVAAPPTSPSIVEEAKIQTARAKLDSDERRMVEAQEFCPVLEKNRLGSMGKPFKILINGQPIFLCCEGCRDEAIGHADETLAKVDRFKRQNAKPGKEK